MSKTMKRMKKSSEGIYHSGVKGITWNKNIDTWRASIRVNGQEYILGFNPNLYELIPLMQRARAKMEEGLDAFFEFYKNEIGREKRVVTPCPYQSDVVGVSFNTKTNKWLAAISIENRKYTLGSFEIQEDAESLRKEADKIKETCENTITESGIIDYTPFYDFLEKLRIEKQQSRLDARIGKGHGKRAWKALKKEQNKLEELEYKALKGELQKELKGLKKQEKEAAVRELSEYPTIRYTLGAYYVFVTNAKGKETYIGKTNNILRAILLYEMGAAKINSSDWLEWYQVEINMGLKIPTMEELLSYFDLSGERYEKMLAVYKNSFGYGTTCSKQTFDKIVVAYNDYRLKVGGQIADRDRVIFVGATTVTHDNEKVPLKGFSFKMEKGQRLFLSDDVAATLYDFEDAKAHLETNTFWHWYLFESGIFENMENYHEEEKSA